MMKILRNSEFFTLDVYVIIEDAKQTEDGYVLSCYPGLEAYTFSESTALQYIEQYDMFQLQLIKITCNIPLRSRKSTKIIPPLLRLF